MTEYFDIRCGDDMDPFGRDAAPLEVLAQDLYHWLITEPGTLILDEEWGFGVEQYLSAPLSPTLAVDIREKCRTEFADRVRDVACTIKPVAGEQDAYRLDLKAECDDEFVTVALKLTPSGVVRVS